ncbi:MAG: hypothetical protein HFF90_02525 [Oscillibacter sp.]|nr:hypothetical protein [Oscillibacter sp.]
MKRAYDREFLICGVLMLGMTAWHLFVRQGSNALSAASGIFVGGVCFYKAFSPRCVELSERKKAIRRELYGAFAPFVEWGPMAGFIILAVLCFCVPKGYEWLRRLYLAGILLMGILIIRYAIAIDKHQRKE